VMLLFNIISIFFPCIWFLPLVCNNSGMLQIKKVYLCTLWVLYYRIVLIYS
jgi:hypothetical protein